MNPAAAPRLLVIDDEPDLRTLYELSLLREGYDVDTAGSVAEALASLGARGYQLVITDMRLPDGSGLDLLRHLEDTRRSERAIVITAYGSAQNAVEALKAGAYDYLTKPVDLKLFRSIVASALGGAAPPAPAVLSALAPPRASRGVAAPAAGEPRPADRAAPTAAGVAAPAPPPDAAATVPPQAAAATSPPAMPSLAVPPPALARLAGESAAMREVRALVQKVARSMAPVLVQGESGTGKELVARAIHAVSPRAGGPFIAVNCGAIPEPLLEAEFFGYRKGAFTGAAADRDGFFQAAHGGTLFLDEIGDLPLSMQSKLLRAIQERAVRPVGEVNEQAVNARLVSATHKDLAQEVQAGRFRQDLYYRLNVIQIRVPPLRERLGDLPAISDAVLERIAADAGVSPAPMLSDDAYARLAAYAFPGNVRELENLLHRAVALSGSDVIGRDELDLPDAMLGSGAADAGEPTSGSAGIGLPSLQLPFASSTLQAVALPASPALPPLPSDLASYLDQVERDILERALDKHRYNRTAAGASLGLSLRQMRYRMARLGIGGGADAPSERGD